MTTTPSTGRKGTAAAQGGVAPGAAPYLPPTKAQRRPWLVGLGVSLAIIGGLASWYYASTVGNTDTVLVVSGDVTRGEVIGTDDLTTLEIASGQTTTAFRASDSRDVIGQVALVDLPEGSLLTHENLGDGLAVDRGKSIVGVALAPSQMPSFPLSAGDEVRLVDTPIAQGDPPDATPSTFRAVVFTTKYDEASSRWIVDLLVTSSQAADIAARSATGRIALILDSAE